jgi:hypothetical protein
MLKSGFWLFVTCIVFGSVLESSGQDLKKEKAKEKGWWFMRQQLGFAFCTGSGNRQERQDQSNGASLIHVLPFSYGKGLNLTYGTGYMLNRHFGLEMDLGYSIGFKTTANNFYWVDTVSVPYTLHQELKVKANVFRLNPSILICTDARRLAPYLKAGIIFGFSSGSSESIENVQYSNGKNSYGKFQWKFSGGQTFGYNTSLGINFKDKDGDANFFIEINHIAMSGTFRKGERTVYMINSVDYLPSLSTYDKEVIFVKELDQNAPAYYAQPRQVLKSRTSFDSIGINFGLIFKL